MIYGFFSIVFLDLKKLCRNWFLVCHPERSEGSHETQDSLKTEILHFVQNDRRDPILYYDSFPTIIPFSTGLRIFPESPIILFC